MRSVAVLGTGQRSGGLMRAIPSAIPMPQRGWPRVIGVCTRRVKACCSTTTSWKNLPWRDSPKDLLTRSRWLQTCRASGANGVHSV